MKPNPGIVFTTALIALLFSCGNPQEKQKAKDTLYADSIPTKKITENSPRTEAQAKALIDGLYKRLMNGEDFAHMADQYSEDPGSNTIGGEYDHVRKGVFVPEFEKVVFNLKLNEISAPFLTEYGYHIATVIAIRKDERDVRHILIQFEK